jgi:hypothetical protein
MVTFLLDEDTDGDLLRALRRRSRIAGGVAVEVTRVGEPDAPPSGTSDPDLLVWCEANEHVLVSNDRNTMPIHFAAHLAAGFHSPGVLLIRFATTLSTVIAELELLSMAGQPDDFRDQVVYIPL